MMNTFRIKAEIECRQCRIHGEGYLGPAPDSIYDLDMADTTSTKVCISELPSGWGLVDGDGFCAKCLPMAQHDRDSRLQRQAQNFVEGHWPDLKIINENGVLWWAVMGQKIKAVPPFDQRANGEYSPPTQEEVRAIARMNGWKPEIGVGE